MSYLGYNFDNNRYGILKNDLWVNEGIHCGESLEALIDGRWIKDRIEMTADGKYYLVNSNLIDTQLEGLKAREG